MDDVTIGYAIGCICGIVVGQLIALKDLKAADRKVRRLEKGIIKTLDKLPFLHGQNSHTLTLASVQEILKDTLDPEHIRWPRA